MYDSLLQGSHSNAEAHNFREWPGDGNFPQWPPYNSTVLHCHATFLKLSNSGSFLTSIGSKEHST
jgi:hypothetical protein